MSNIEWYYKQGGLQNNRNHISKASCIAKKAIDFLLEKQGKDVYMTAD